MPDARCPASKPRRAHIVANEPPIDNHFSSGIRDHRPEDLAPRGVPSVRGCVSLRLAESQRIPDHQGDTRIDGELTSTRVWQPRGPCSGLLVGAYPCTESMHRNREIMREL